MSASKYRALVVDDEPYIRELTVHALQNHAVQCDTASDGEEGLALAKRQDYDAVITDLRMPRRNGHSLATELLAWPNRPRIFVLTGLTEPRLAQDLRGRGVDDVLQKPIDFEELALRVCSQLDSRAASTPQQASQCEGDMLARIEKTLLVLTESFSDRIEGLFEINEALIDPPTAVNFYIERLGEAEAAADEKVVATECEFEGRRHRRERARVQAVALAVPVTKHFVPCEEPFKLAVRDISETGVRLLHTRATNAEFLALKWPSKSMPLRDIAVVSRMMRCEPLSRFYDFGCQFVQAD
jgi:DNA-binding response OmpR family regulator